jgi:hypothetical protein
MRMEEGYMNTRREMGDMTFPSNMEGTELMAGKRRLYLTSVLFCPFILGPPPPHHRSLLSTPRAAHSSSMLPTLFPILRNLYLGSLIKSF